MEKIVKNPFGVDEIHTVRLQIAEERAKLTPEEARRAFIMEVDAVRRRIEEVRQRNQNKKTAL